MFTGNRRFCPRLFPVSRHIPPRCSVTAAPAEDGRHRANVDPLGLRDGPAAILQRMAWYRVRGGVGIG
jgi:hypothetical protein